MLGGGGRLRCLQGKADTNILWCVAICLATAVGSTQSSGCMMYGPGAMAAICPFQGKNSKILL